MTLDVLLFLLLQWGAFYTIALAPSLALTAFFVLGALRLHATQAWSNSAASIDIVPGGNISCKEMLAEEKERIPLALVKDR